MKVKYVKAIQENISKFYAQVITDTYVEIVVVELCFEIKTKETFHRSTFSKLVLSIPCSLMFPIKNGVDGEGGGGGGWEGGEGAFTYRSKSVKHDESYLLRIP